MGVVPLVIGEFYCVLNLWSRYLLTTVDGCMSYTNLRLSAVLNELGGQNLSMLLLIFGLFYMFLMFY
jgi:hypothetical protein